MWNSRENNEDFIKFPVEKLVDNSTTDFDLFLNLEDHFILYGPPGYRWVRDELTDLLRSGHGFFHILRKDAPRAKMYLEISKIPTLEKNLAPKDRINSIQDITASFIKCLYEGDITPACIDKASTLSNSLVDCLQEDVTAVHHLKGFAERDYYTYYHSVRVATYAVAIAMSMSNKSQEDLRAMAIGGIFHDIGKMTIPLEVINKKGPLTEAEWEFMKAHPTKGAELVGETLASHVPREIILHHHEKLNGKGYPDGLEKDSLIEEVQIATVADIFDALTSSRSYQNKRSRFEALDFIRHKMLNESISIECFKALVSSLSPDDKT